MPDLISLAQAAALDMAYAVLSGFPNALAVAQADAGRAVWVAAAQAAVTKHIRRPCLAMSFHSSAQRPCPCTAGHAGCSPVTGAGVIGGALGAEGRTLAA